ncbi:hypothetical protein QO010_002186 [Caulobacter ginsengisoli]|uniref:Phage tail protein n=1 Tax=Caulobacter ginsengisoli TaxID=400775 RepID=A0ABU0IQW1_9CAUL|nr:hypothetical protein [Caulobacter ginsengisoli]MDQ0464405.1 hypothetical protein [Caulobacter ginsengisoli]
MAGKFLRGALIEFNDSLPIPTPNIIIFQFNPEGMTNSWAAAGGAAAGKSGAGSSGDPMAAAGNPVQSFSLDLAMSATDMIADGGVGGGLATVSGIYTRIAALEMLMFPVDTGGGGLLGSVSAAFGGGAPAPKTKIPKGKVPMVLFVWGPGRIVPVRVTSLSIKETLYDPILLNPTQATATVGLQVLTPEVLANTTGILKDVSVAAWNINHALRQALAIANLANAVESSIGMLPF